MRRALQRGTAEVLFGEPGQPVRQTGPVQVLAARQADHAEDELVLGEAEGRVVRRLRARPRLRP